jgi:hypothetical protein
MGSNDNPTYLDFWPVVSKVWKEVFKITPVLGLISDTDSDLYDDGNGLIKKFKSIKGVDSALQSQIVRIFLPKFLNGNSLLSDIDMLPLSKKYFIEQFHNFDDNKFYVLSSDNPECIEDNQYPICYNLGNKIMYEKIFDLNKSWSDFVIELNNMGNGWVTDQKFLFQKITQYESQKEIIKLNRGWNPWAINRIDRINWFYDKKMVISGEYIDSHLLRPYNNYRQQIDELINLLY